MGNKIQFRRGTAAEATAANEVLDEGMPGFEMDTGKFKIGDGTTAWNDLAYATGEGGGAAVLDDLSDVDTDGATDDDVLTYDDGQWVPKEPTAGGDIPDGDEDDLVALDDQGGFKAIPSDAYVASGIGLYLPFDAEDDADADRPTEPAGANFIWFNTPEEPANLGEFDLWVGDAVEGGVPGGGVEPVFIQAVQAGTETATSTVTGTFALAPSEGSYLIASLMKEESTSVVAPSGWESIYSSPNDWAELFVRVADGTSTDESVTFDTGSGRRALVLMEFEGAFVGASDVVDRVAVTTQASGVEVPIGPTPTTTTAPQLAIAVITTEGALSTQTATFDNDYTHRGSAIANTGGSSSARRSIIVATKVLSSTKTTETTGTMNQDRPVPDAFIITLEVD